MVPVEDGSPVGARVEEAPIVMSESAPPESRENLRRTVRMELYLAPLLILLPAFVGWSLIDMGARGAGARYLGLGIVIVGINLTFGLLMIRSARIFLKRTAG